MHNNYLQQVLPKLQLSQVSASVFSFLPAPPVSQKKESKTVLPSYQYKIK